VSVSNIYMSTTAREKKHFSRFHKPLVEIPNLVEAQLNSFHWLLEEGLKATFKEFTPIRDYSEKKFELEFSNFEIGKPKFDEYHAKENMLTYDAVLRANVKLINKTLNILIERYT